MPKQFSILIIIFFFIALIIAERIWPLRRRTQPWMTRFIINALIAIPMFLVASLLVRPVGWHTLLWTGYSSFGLLHLLKMPVWLQYGSGFLLLDLSFYYWHWLNHRVPLLWRFHNVHHIDPDLDVSTAIRFHAVEVAYSTLFRFVQIGLLGVAPIIFISYEICFQLNTFFQHSNLRLPIKLERILNYVIVTPRMHGIHHSQVMNELNSNFSVVFSWWDHLHRTIRLNIPQQAIRIGVAGYYLSQDNHFWRLIIMPFTKQRNYWRLPDGSLPKRSEVVRENRDYLLR